MSIGIDQILRIAESNIEETFKILTLDKRASFKVYCETLVKDWAERDFKLYNSLIKGLTKFGLRKPIVDHFIHNGDVMKWKEFNVALILHMKY